MFSGEKVSKDSVRMRVLGDLDELTAALGVARVCARRADVRRRLLQVQRRLFTAAAEVATSVRRTARLPERLGAADLADLEGQLHKLESSVIIPRGFIVPGGAPGGAGIDLARAICRRVERGLTQLVRAGSVRNEYLQAWMNRLSGLLWLLARREEGRATLAKE